VDADSAPPQRRRRSRAVGIIGWIGASLGILLIVAIVGIVIYSQVGVMAAEPGPLAAVKANPAISITDDSAAIVRAPVKGATGDGLVFIPGAKVDPWAYAAKLSGIVESGTTVGDHQAVVEPRIFRPQAA